MWIGNHILLSSVTATLLLTSCPVSAIAAEVGAISGDGTFDISVAAGDTITLDDNSGTLNAIEIDPWIDTGVSILNEGIITIDSINGSDATGIISISNAGYVNNTGVIDVSTNHVYATGVYITFNQADAKITNESTGTISVTSIDGGADGIYIIENYGVVENYGSIDAISENNNAVGIHTEWNETDVTVATITNKSTGTISATSINGGAYGIVALENLSVIENYGSINAISENGNAVGISTDYNHVDAIITNIGTIIAGSTNGDAYGIYVNDNTGTITNSGTITAPTAVYIYSGSGTFNNMSSGIINGDLQMGSTDVQNNGVINLASISNVSNVNNFTQGAGGVLEIRLNSGANGVAEYSKLSANGTVTLISGTTLNVNVQTSTDYQGLLIGQQLADVISATTLTADISTLNVTDTSALLNFVPVVDGATLDLNVVKGVSILDATQNSVVVGAYGAASVLGEYAGDDSDLTAFISSLNTLGTEEEVAQAILETTPTTTTALSNMSTQFYNNIGSIVQSHQNNLRGMNSGDMVFGDKNLWIKPFGSYSKQNNKDGLNGFSANSKGVGIGLDGEYENNQRIGLAVFYTQADIDTNNVNQNTKLDIFNLIVYGNFPIIDNSTNLFYQLGMGLQQTSSTRTITAPTLTAKADYNAKTLFANIKLARDTALNNTLNLSNQLFGTYVYYKNPSYSESGAGGLNLNVQGFNTTSLVFGVEESLKYSMIEGTNLILNVALGYDFGDTKQDVLASYYGASGTAFTTSGIDNGPWSYKTGVEIAQELQNNLSVSVGYDLDGKGSDFKNHSVSAKVNWKF